jgi:hypothetical protein
MSSGQPEGTYIKSEILMRIFRKLKMNPNRTFLAKDFGNNNSFARKYLNILIKMNLIEIVGVRYKTGAKYTINKAVKGYKWK